MELFSAHSAHQQQRATAFREQALGCRRVGEAAVGRKNQPLRIPGTQQGEQIGQSTMLLHRDRLLLDTLPTVYTYAGALLISGSGLYMLWREHRGRREAAVLATEPLV